MNKRVEYVSIGLFFACLLLLGLLTYRDYGISWDETVSRTNGAVTVNYLAEKFHIPALITPGFPDLGTYKDRDYGVAFEAPAFALEHILGLKDSRDIFIFRHLLTFLVSFAGVYAVYRLSRRRFSDWRIGLLSALFLVLSPRLFADSFYNDKDVVFMALFAVAMNTTVSFVLRPRITTALVNALATAVAIDVRVMALLLAVVSVTLLIMRLIRRELRLGRTCLVLAVYASATSAFVILMWPYLWSNPLAHFVHAFRNMAQFRWPGPVRYLGAFIPATKLPWHYPFVWISITTPLLYLALFAVGLYTICRRMLGRGIKLWQDDVELQDILFLGLFFAPILAVSLFHSVIYDGWRQLYFLYPAFLLVATTGWVMVWSIKSARNLYRASLLSLTAISVFSTAIWMWKAHPLENVYFNSLAGRDLKARYEIDYWGVGNRKALEYILEKDHSPVVNVWAGSATSITDSVLLLKPEDRLRVRVEEIKWFPYLKPEDRLRVRAENDEGAPYYVLTNYRLVNETDNPQYSRDYEPFYEVRVGGEVVLSVFKWKGPPPALISVSQLFTSELGHSTLRARE